MDRVVDISFEEQAGSASGKVRLKIRVSGIVQGVGFRPFIYRLAEARGLAGYVLNDPAGVEMEVEGPLESVSDFLPSIVREKPPQARVDTLSAHFVDAKGESGFLIRESEAGSGRSALISPEIATCPDCLRELNDPADRRYRYPFTNCTNCGPRYTIIGDIPYDRRNTTMKVFEMCHACRAEYEDPADRRFHAEPNACWDCGPRVTLRDGSGRPVECDDAIDAAIGLLRESKVLAVKGLGGFHLAVDAADDGAVRLLRERKRREEKPLAVMARDLDAVRAFALVGPEEEAAILSPARPIVLLKKRPDCIIAESVAPGNRSLGVMLPYTPLHHLLLMGGFAALVMTSGNISEEPIAIDIEDAQERLGGIADYYLDHNREILSRCDDSVVRVVNGEPLFLRRSRGYVPLPLSLDVDMPCMLACGAHLKNTVALTRGNQVFVSQHIGDLENLAAYEFFKTSIAGLARIIDVEPTVAVHDLHPDYLSTKYALELPFESKIGVQHHHAHIASCLGEAGIDKPVIGFALDGTGYGPDGTIWGCEALISTRAAYERVAHLETVGMPGGEKAVLEPWRMALTHMHNAFGGDLDGIDLAGLLGRDGKEIGLVKRMLDRRLNCPVTSSCGRLFDAVSALCGIRDRVSYEGQAAVELEMAVREDVVDVYTVEIKEDGETLILSPKAMLKEVVRDLLSGTDTGVVAARFHNWLASGLAETARLLRAKHGIDIVALSGGCFQNEILLKGLKRLLTDKGFEVIVNKRVPTNDGGISFGQVVVASAMLERESRTE
jgi:hydrogenase maturation protein HypF